MSIGMDCAPLGENDNFDHSVESTDKKFANLTQREKRSLLFHLLYAAESFEYQNSLESIVDNLNRGFDLDIPLESDMVMEANNIIENREELDQTYKPLLTNWRFDRLGVCTKLILRYATWELLHSSVNPTIIINEAVELAKCFAEKDAYKFINGILDKVPRKYIG